MAHLGVAVLLASLCSTAALHAAAQPASGVAFPAYRTEHALQGLYAHQLPPLYEAFENEAAAMTRAARQHCSGQTKEAGLQASWARTRLAWMAVANPALGPLITRRTQREIDFWPVRPALLKRALEGQPQTLDQMERVGGPAKGLPAMEWLLASEPASSHCPYLALIAEGIEAEARALKQDLAALAAKDWTADEDSARAAFAEWVNQWLGGLESLRWQQIEQPLQKARTAGQGQAPAFARRRLEDNRADWSAQWQSLQAQARVTPQGHNSPPQPGQAPIPIEALLLGKGHIALAQRWGNAIDDVSAGMAALPARPSERDLMALSSKMKAVSSLYQSEVASALDVPLGFSSADGD